MSATISNTQAKTARGPAALLSLALIVAMVFVAGFALPYFLKDPSRIAQYPGKETWIILHIATGMMALLVGPFVLWFGVTRRRMQLHRKLGLAYIGSIAVSSIAAYYLAFHTVLGWVFGLGLASLATVWVITTGLAFAAVRRRMIDQHKEWMIRSYVTTFGFVNFRILVGLLQTTNVGTLTEQLTAASWFAWAVPLVITEAILQGRKIFRAPAAQRASR